MYEGERYTMRTSPKFFMNQVRFIDWLRTVFLPWNDNIGRKSQYKSPIILFLDGHAGHVTPWVLAYARLQKILIIQLIPQLSHISTTGRLVCLQNL
jgi:hypothetical protein